MYLLHIRSKGYLKISLTICQDPDTLICNGSLELQAPIQHNATGSKCLIVYVPWVASRSMLTGYADRDPSM